MSKNKKKMRTGKKIAIILTFCAGVIILAVVAAFLHFYTLLGKVHYVPLKKSSSASAVSADNNGDPLMFDNNVFNVLLIGTDTRGQPNDDSRSDSMILISINKNTQKIVMTSFMRDIYLPIPGHGSNRLNAAYSFGGVDLLLDTIQQNFDVKIDKYAQVDFFSFIDIIDKLGGVNIDVKDAEVPALNSCVEEINSLENLPPTDGILKKGGDDLLLTGKQALGYSRIRYVGNGDFERTERQRTVLTKVFSKLKGQNIVKLNSILNMLLPDITTNLTQGELSSLVLQSLTYLKYPEMQERVPIDGSFTDATIDKMDVLKIDFDKNIAALKSGIYG